MVRHLVFGSFVIMLVSATPAAGAQRTFVRSDGLTGRGAADVEGTISSNPPQ